MKIVELRHIIKTKNSFPILKNISFSIYKNEVLGIVGPSGSGKTTLIQVAGFMSEIDSGDLLFCGDKPNADAVLNIRKDKVGFIYQQDNLIKGLSCIDNVAIQELIRSNSNKMAYKNAEWALDRVGLLSLKDRTVNCLSGGERQKVSIARAIVKSPLLICADEPTGSLDSASAINIFYILNQIADDGTAVVIVTHDNELSLKYTDRSIRIKDGEIQ